MWLWSKKMTTMLATKPIRAMTKHLFCENRLRVKQPLYRLQSQPKADDQQGACVESSSENFQTV
jgi:hypothetical protein